MPPKKEDTGQDKNIMVLIHLLTSATEFKVDTSSLSTKLGLAHAKNCGRTINAVISPYGYEFKGGKVVSKHDSSVNYTHKGGKESTITSEDASDVTTKKPSRKRAKSDKAEGEAGDTRSTAVKKQKAKVVKEEQESEEEETAEDNEEI